MDEWTTSNAQLALPLSGLTILCVWLAYGQTRWGLRVGAGLLGIALVWEYLLDISDTLHINNSAVSLLLLSHAAGIVIACYFLEWLDIRFVNQFETHDPKNASNAEVNLVDLLLGTAGIAVVLAVMGNHEFARLSEVAAVLSMLSGLLIAFFTMVVFWSVISTTLLTTRIGVLLTTVILETQVLAALAGANHLRLPWSIAGLEIGCAVIVFFLAVVAGYCGYRFNIPPRSAPHRVVE